MLRHLMMSWHLNTWKVKIWLSQEWKELFKWNKRHFCMFHKCSVQYFSSISISMCELTRVHLILRKSFSSFFIVKKQLTLHFKRFRCYRWHKNISTFRYLIDCWITIIDCNKFINHVLFILRLQLNWETIFKCQLRKGDWGWIFDFWVWK